MRILHICETAKGGVGTYIGLFGEFSADLARSTVVAPAPHVSQVGTKVEVVPYSYPSRGIRALSSMIRATLSVRRRIEPDVYFFHSTFSLVALLLLRLGFDSRTAIFCSHGWACSRYEEGSWKRRIVQSVEGTLCGLADVVVNVSEGERALAEKGGYRGKHVVLENAVPEPLDGAPHVAPERGTPSRAIRLLFVGRLDRQKGLDLLLEAWRAIGSQRKDLELHVVGASVNNDATLAELPPRVRLHGWIDRADIDAWYRSADAMVVPSRWEGLPLVVPEALRNGTPVLVSDRSGMPGLIEEGKTGHSYPLSSQGIRTCLEGLDLDALRGMRPNCREAYERRFSLERFRKGFASILADLAPVAPQKSARKVHG
ncbi:hypothetical protein OCH239_01270 [Roseivivax halodurans JCM 10272]|uniref:Glycosyltransferase subfamily 4-like N-terminal domain-containing protein n=1 Tax=Roseivivax halodurans JCM 10272 TaxID=1449350 RepID=X7EKU5_9RHOB|nr:glycosyltransferase family 4 protein [Roseivivax halodurans]ETX16719.1 hypothetical protein OCH239_01270 [Roseivivax halodurans JCM 10272]